MGRVLHTNTQRGSEDEAERNLKMLALKDCRDSPTSPGMLAVTEAKRPRNGFVSESLDGIFPYQYESYVLCWKRNFRFLHLGALILPSYVYFGLLASRPVR